MRIGSGSVKSSFMSSLDNSIISLNSSHFHFYTPTVVMVSNSPDGSKSCYITTFLLFLSVPFTHKELSGSRNPSSLMTSPRAPPGEKWFGEQSRISWAYYSKAVRTNENARSLSTSLTAAKFIHHHSNIRTFFERVVCERC